MSTAHDRQDCPYVGLDPFTAADRDYFFGREREQRIITANLLSAPLTVLYGPAAVGKSSLLMAGVVPHLGREQPGTPVVLFRDWRGEDFVRRLARACVEATRATGVDWPRPGDDLPLDEVLRTCSEAVGGTVLLLLDQFEDFLSNHPKSFAPESFEAQLARAVNREEVDVGILLAVREASLAWLDRFQERIPNLLGNRVRLRHLEPQGAERAIREPVRVWNERHGGGHRVSVEDELVKAVVQQVRTGALTLGAARGKDENPSGDASIEAPFLQLVMTRLWSEDQPSGCLKRATLTRLHEADAIVRAHLDGLMSGLDPSTQAVCATFFDRLVTPTGGRVTFSTEDLARWAHGEGEQVSSAVVEMLSANRVLRTVDAPAGVPEVARYEIFSDVLAPAILAWHAGFVEKRRRERAVLAAREQARRRARRIGVWGLGVGLVVAVGLWCRAEVAGRRAEANQWAAEARNATRSDARLALQRALAAADRTWPFAPTVPAVDALRLAVQASAAAEWTQVVDGPVRSVAFSPDGQRIAAGVGRRRGSPNAGTTVTVRSSESGEPIGPEARLERTTGDAGGVAWLPGVPGRPGTTAGMHRLAAAVGQEALVLAEDDLRSPLGEFAHGDEIYSAFAVSRDGRWIAAGGSTRTSRARIHVWDASDPNTPPRTTIEVGKGWLFGLAFSPDGGFLAGASVDPLDDGGNHVAVWQVGTGRRVLTLPMLVGSDSVVFAPDGQYLAASGRDSRVYLWPGVGAQLAAIGGKPAGPGGAMPVGPARVLAGHLERVRKVVVSPDGARLASAGADGNVKLWDASTGECLMTFDAHDGFVEAIAFSPDGARLVSGGRDRRLRMWDVGRHSGAIQHVALGADLAATASSDRSIRLWNVSSGVPRLQRVLSDEGLGPLRSHADTVFRVAFDRDARVLASASFDKKVKLWDVGSGRLLRTLGGHADQLRDVTFSSDGRYLASAGADGRALLRSLREEDAVPVEVQVEGAQVHAVAIHPDPQRRLWVTGAEGAPEVRLWDFEGKRLGAVTLGVEEGTSIALAFTDGGARLAVLAGRTLYRFSTRDLLGADGRELAREALETIRIGGARRCRGLAHAAASGRVAVGCSNGTVVVFDANADRPAQAIHVHDEEVMGLAFNADGSVIGSGSLDRTFVVSPLDNAALVDCAKRRLAALESKP